MYKLDCNEIMAERLKFLSRECVRQVNLSQRNG